MKTNFFAVVLALLTFVSTLNVFAEKEERNVSKFSEVSLRISGKLYIEQGKKQSIEIDAKPSTLEKIVTEVNDGKLVIRFTKKNYLWGNFDTGKIDIYITVPEIEGLNISGSGTIIAENEITTKNMDLAISGSGDILLDELQAEKVKASISGSGDVVIEDGGLAENLYVSVSGSGDVKASGFKTKEASVKIAGSGNVSLNAIEILKARIAGSGDIIYKGNPDVDSSVAGSGRVKKMQ